MSLCANFQGTEYGKSEVELCPRNIKEGKTLSGAKSARKRQVDIWIRGHPGLHRELKASRVRPCSHWNQESSRVLHSYTNQNFWRHEYFFVVFLPCLQVMRLILVFLDLYGPIRSNEISWDALHFVKYHKAAYFLRGCSGHRWPECLTGVCVSMCVSTWEMASRTNSAWWK